MNEKITKILLDNFKKGNFEIARNQLLDLFTVSNKELIDYIENDAEILIPIEDFFNEDGTHITYTEYGHVLLKHLVEELRLKFC